MRRLFWVALGAAAGVAAVRTLAKKAQAYTPKGIARSVAGIGDSVRGFVDDVRAGMAEREVELAAAMQDQRVDEIERLVREDASGRPSGRPSGPTGGGWR